MTTNDRFDHFFEKNVREDQILKAITSTSASHGGVLVGPGDDAAVLPPVAASLWLSVSTSALNIFISSPRHLWPMSGSKPFDVPRGILRPWLLPQWVSSQRPFSRRP